MLGKIVEKAAGRMPFPLVIADATQLPFGDGRFGGAYARHVLHLVDLGLNEGPWQEVGDHIDQQVGRGGHRVVGLDFDGIAELDGAMARFGASYRDLPEIWQESELTLDRYFAEIDGRAFSWTWRVDPERLAVAVAGTKRWAAERFGSFDRVLEPRFRSIWRAYDLP
jgi:hypothetical protein